MKRAGIAFCLMILLLRSGLAQTSSASHPDDDAAIKRVVAQYAEYWNRHEFAKTAELRTDDSENVNVVGQRSTRADIAKGGRRTSSRRSGTARFMTPLSASNT